MDETITAHELLAAQGRPSGSFRFDEVRYDRAGDVLTLAVGPPSASLSERTPEGHLVRIDPVENRIIGIEIENARDFVARSDDPIVVTVGPGQRLLLSVQPLRDAVTQGRFDRSDAVRAADAMLTKAAAAKRFAR